MTGAELNLAFAREVAGYPDAKWDHSYDIPVLTSGVDEPVFDGSRVGQRILPDYASDWNATIAVLEHRGMSWGTEYVGGQKYFWVESGSLFKIEEGKGPSALMLAAVKCVREQGNG